MFLGAVRPRLHEFCGGRVRAGAGAARGRLCGRGAGRRRRGAVCHLRERGAGRRRRGVARARLQGGVRVRLAQRHARVRARRTRPSAHREHVQDHDHAALLRGAGGGPPLLRRADRSQRAGGGHGRLAGIFGGGRLVQGGRPAREHLHRICQRLVRRDGGTAVRQRAHLCAEDERAGARAGDDGYRLRQLYRPARERAVFVRARRRTYALGAAGA